MQKTLRPASLIMQQTVPLPVKEKSEQKQWSLKAGTKFTITTENCTDAQFDSVHIEKLKDKSKLTDYEKSGIKVYKRIKDKVAHDKNVQKARHELFEKVRPAIFRIVRYKQDFSQHIDNDELLGEMWAIYFNAICAYNPTMTGDKGIAPSFVRFLQQRVKQAMEWYIVNQQPVKLTACIQSSIRQLNRGQTVANKQYEQSASYRDTVNYYAKSTYYSLNNDVQNDDKINNEHCFFENETAHELETHEIEKNARTLDVDAVFSKWIYQCRDDYTSVQFLTVLATTGCVKTARKESGISPVQITGHMKVLKAMLRDYRQ